MVWTWAAHLPAVLWLFGSALFADRLPYFRDLSTYYAPHFAFAADSLRGGTWPLWNPTVHAGEPFLIVYPIDLLLLWLSGWRGALALGPAFHLWLALAGGSWLGRRLGLSPAAAWLAGTAYGLGGFVLSLVSLLQLYEAAAWAPWVIAAAVGLAGRAGPRGAALLAALVAVQTSTLSVEIVAQTLVMALVLALDARGRLVGWRWFAAAAGLAAALAAPALAGGAWLVRGTARADGYGRDELLAFSLHPGVLPELALPRWLGDPHGFSDAGYWGTAFFPEGYPYLVSLYLGVGVLILAAQARRPRRLWLLTASGVLLALGAQGPLALLPDGVRLPVRGPQKLLFLAQLSLPLLAGFGLDRRTREAPSRTAAAGLLAPGAVVLALALAVSVAPGTCLDAAGRLWPPLLDPRAAVAARLTWPTAWLPAGALALAAGLALVRTGRVARLAAVAAAFDLAAANGPLNPLAPSSFYDLRPEVAALLRPVREEGSRIFSYGVAQTPGLHFEPVMRAAASDVWLYYLDRQSLLASTHALDGLEGAYGPDQTGFTSAGASLGPHEGVPERFGEHRLRLEQAGVRWLLSFRELPSPWTRPRGEVKLPEITLPLRLYELPGAVPRARLVGPPAGSGAAEVRWQRLDAHTIRLDLRSGPGLVIVAEGHHPDWRAEGPEGAVPVRRAGERGLAFVTAGGERRFLLRFRPAWPLPSMLLSATAWIVTAVALLVGCVRDHD